MKARHLKTLEVEITSAYELSSDESEALKSALSEKLGRDIELDISVDEKLIGGAIIKQKTTSLMTLSKASWRSSQRI